MGKLVRKIKRSVAVENKKRKKRSVRELEKQLEQARKRGQFNV